MHIVYRDHARTHQNSDEAINIPTKKDVTKWATTMVVKDIRPFDMIENSGFREFAQKMIDLG